MLFIDNCHMGCSIITLPHILEGLLFCCCAFLNETSNFPDSIVALYQNIPQVGS